MAWARISPDAERDIDQIARYIAQDSIDAALKWYDELDTFFRRLQYTPGMGTSREYLRAGLRSVPFGKYLVFFQKVGREIEILRIIHGAQQWERMIDEHE